MSTSTSQPTASPQDPQWAAIAMVGGVLSILFGLWGMFSIAKTTYDLFSIMGGSFMLEYLASSGVYAMTAILSIIGGVLLIQKNAWGWVLVVADSISGLIHFIIAVITYLEFPISFDHIEIQTVFYLANLLFTMAVLITFFLPGFLRFMNIKGDQIGLAVGIGAGFVILGFATRFLFGLFD